MNKAVLRRTTRQKTAILDELKKLKSHPTASAIFKTVRRRIPSISFGTVYRNLNLLKNEGKILELTSGKYSCRYDGDVRGHYHFFCLECKKVFDIAKPILKNLNEKVSEESGIIVEYHRVDFYGYCRACKRGRYIEGGRAGLK